MAVIVDVIVVDIGHSKSALQNPSRTRAAWHSPEVFQAAAWPEPWQASERASRSRVSSMARTLFLFCSELLAELVGHHQSCIARKCVHTLSTARKCNHCYYESKKALQNLSRRELHSMALEHAKLLLGLDPTDPQGVLFCIIWDSHPLLVGIDLDSWQQLC